MEAISLPRVVGDHDVGLQGADRLDDLGPGRQVVLELAVDASEEHDLAPLLGAGVDRRTGSVPRRAARPGAGRRARRCRRRDPTCPSTRRCTRGGARPCRRPPTWRASPPAPNSMSSGWAPIASTQPGGARSIVAVAANAAASLLSVGWPGSFATMGAAPRAASGGAGRRACRRRATGTGRGVPRPGSARVVERHRQVRTERVGAVARSQRRPDRQRHHVRAAEGPVGHDRDRVADVASRARSDANGRSLWAIDDVVEALAGDRLAARVDGAVEAHPGAPQHFGAGCVGPLGDDLVVARHEDGGRRPPTRSPARPASGRARPARREPRSVPRRPLAWSNRLTGTSTATGASRRRVSTGTGTIYGDARINRT